MQTKYIDFEYFPPTYISDRQAFRPFNLTAPAESWFRH